MHFSSVIVQFLRFMGGMPAAAKYPANRNRAVSKQKGPGPRA